MSGLGIVELINHRLNKKGLYDSSRYWDLKAQAYDGLARSNWPSNAYNAHVHARQMTIVSLALGDVRGLSIADVGCGTGRVSLHLAERGAHVIGFDFAPKQLEVARATAKARNIDARFEWSDIRELPARAAGRFDVALTVGAVALACNDPESFEKTIRGISGLLKPGGRVLFLEPIHGSWLLRRILPMGVDEWIERCQSLGLSLVSRGGMGFVPCRFALAFRELPKAVVTPMFRAGERLLDRSSGWERLADYKWLLFRHAGA